MNDPGVNERAGRLSNEKSPFLRHGQTQPVDWRTWGEAAFAEARERDCPVLLDIGAVWCHWCHVMDRESYEDEQTAALINELYVPVKVDRDERPDVDARYQRAVQLLTGQGGWPLTAFLTPDGDAFYGGTYFPPVDGHGRPSFRRVLTEVSRVWHEDRDRAADAVRSIDDRIRSVAASETQSGEVSPAIVNATIEALADSWDFRHPGFGRAPKFPNPGGLDLILDRYLDTGDDWARRVVSETLTAMGRGGIFDQLGGGFHRYSTDARWIIPHFEKMAYDNGPLLSTCAAAASALDDRSFAEFADGIIAHYLDVAPDLVSAGGFPASQDADSGADDDGDYWTWTADELSQALDDEVAFNLARMAYGLADDASRMPFDPNRHVLFRPMDNATLAGRLGMPEADVRSGLETVRARLKAVRDLRPAPCVDRTPYAGWVALVGAGHLRAARYLGRKEAGEAGLRAIETVWRDAFVRGHGICHRVGDPDTGPVLDDQAFVLDALIDAFELTQDRVWLDRAADLCAVLERRFLDPLSGGLRDRPAGDTSVRTMDQPLFPITDSPTPSGNGAAALALLRLATLTGNAGARALADSILRAFAGIDARLLGGAATYAKAVAMATLPVTTVAVIDSAATPGESELFTAALRTYRPRSVIRLLGPGDAADSALPEAMRAMMKTDRPRAYACSGRTCAPPVESAAQLVDLLRSFPAG